MGHRGGLIFSRGLRRWRGRGIDDLRLEVRAQLADGCGEELGVSLATLVQRANRDEILTLIELARLCNEVLAWDSWSFCQKLGIDVDDVRALDISSGDRRRLDEMNGSPFTYNLHDWST